MKKCENCSLCYPDSVNMCERCGSALTEYTGREEKKTVMGEKEKSHYWCDAVRKICYYVGVTIIFVGATLAIFTGWESRSWRTFLIMLFIAFVTGLIFLVMSCLLECLIYKTFGVINPKKEEKKENKNVSPSGTGKNDKRA